MFQHTEIKLKYGTDYKNVAIPTKNILDIIVPEDLPAANDQLEEVRRSLKEPINSKPLSVLAKGKKNVFILCSDITRPSPSYLLVPPILEELNTAGVEDENITIVFGLGYHRPHTIEEMKKLVGEDIYNRVRCIDHDRNKCVHIGDTSRGTPIWLFEPVSKADFIIGTGNLEFHYKAGYSGGYKALMPGVCSKESIQANHCMMIKPGTMPGKSDGNPMREDIEEAGKMAGMKFIVNAILDSSKNIVKCVSGDPISAHRQGSKYIDMMYKRPIPEKADIVLCCPGGHPKDINLYQTIKTMDNALYGGKENSILILLSECIDGLGADEFADWFKYSTLEDMENALKDNFTVPGYAAYKTAYTAKYRKVVLISSLDDELVKNFNMIPCHNLDEAVRMAYNMCNYEEPKITLMPYGGNTLPISL